MKSKACVSVVTSSLIALLLVCGLGVSAEDQVTQQPTTSAVPNLIRYGGVLKDANGAVLASQTLGVTFALYKQQEGGVALWTETRNLTTNAAGQYSVTLGSTKPEGVSADLFSEQEQRWLGVQVQGQPEQSRVLMVSVPYAFRAHEAETLGGLPASAFVKAATTDTAGGTSTDLGTAANALSSLANTGVASGKTSNGSILPPVTVGNGPCFAPSGVFYIPIFANPTGSIICNSVIYQTGFSILGPPGPNVGIGMVPVAPARLDVNGAATEGINTTDNKFAYMISHQPVLSIFPLTSNNLFAGVGAGTNNATGHDNTFSGYQAGNANVGGTGLLGSFNTFSGSQAGLFNTTGFQNTFTGYTAGFGNGTGYQNSCFGSAACLHNLTGIENVAIGAGAGFRNDIGSENTYVGFDSGWSNSGNINNNTFAGWESGFNNTASNGSFYGYQAGYQNNADGNSFYGYKAGFANTTGDSNTFVGYAAGTANITGGGNTFVGYTAGEANSGSPSFGNTFVGEQAGASFNSGFVNTFIGAGAGFNSYQASGNIYIGSFGSSFDPYESSTIRIGGDPGAQTDAYMSGIWSSPPGVTSVSQVVCVDNNGKLWGVNTLASCITSSRRFKEQIADMGDSTSKLLQLRPVSFFYKPQYDDGSHLLQYGLIAEEVAKIYPDMVVYDKNGQPYTVKYQMLTPMLLNEFQKQHAAVTAQQTEVQSLREQTKAQQQQMLAQQQEIEGLKSQLQLQSATFQQRLSRLESLVTTRMQTTADKPAPAITIASSGLQ